MGEEADSLNDQFADRDADEIDYETGSSVKPKASVIEAPKKPVIETGIAGFRAGFFPSRPATGFPLHSLLAIDEFLKRIEGQDSVLQPKLNGDRACLIVNGTQTVLYNRHGSVYSFKVKNLSVFSKLGGSWVFDGEVWQNEFLPFECLKTSKHDLTKKCVTLRIKAAEDVSRRLGIRWMFSTPDRDWLIEHFNSEGRLSNPTWEGVVRKATRTPYVQGRNDNEPTRGWFRHKW